MELYHHEINTPLGPMVALADEEALYLLEFVDCRKLERKIKQLTNKKIEPGRTAPIRSIEVELRKYFEEKLKEFKTPCILTGTPFQQQVWESLRKIPYGKTISYAQLAAAIGKPTAFRAVAQANGSNYFPLVIPCHRVINTSGELGGYSSGIERKKWLLNHEL